LFIRIVTRLFTPNLGEYESMQSIYSLYKLVDKYASEIEKLNLNNAQLEEYSSVLLQLQRQVETGEPSHKIVNQWLAYLSKLSVPFAETV